MSRIVLAYSGGLDTSVLLKKLILEGQRGRRDDGRSRRKRRRLPAPALAAALEAVRSQGARARRVRRGADRRARALHRTSTRLRRCARTRSIKGVYPLSAALSRPLIAELLVETAASTAPTRSRTAAPARETIKCASSSACALSIRTWSLAPLRENRRSRAPTRSPSRKRNGVPIAHTAAKPYSVDANLVGPLDRSRRARRSLERAARGRLCLDRIAGGGRPAARRDRHRFRGRRAVASTASSGAGMVVFNSTRAGAHGVGRIDMIEDRVVGLKSREVYECPAAIDADRSAHKALERFVLTRDELRFKALARPAAMPS
jgi:argininosuccinate synthase